MPSADQIENIVQTAAAAPVNNMVVLVAIGIVVFLIISAVIIYKVGPLLIQLFKQQADTLSALKEGFIKLVDMKADTVEWQRSHSLAVEDTNKHLIALTQNIKTRSELDGQAFDEMRDEVGKKIDENNEAVMKRITALEDGVNKLNTSVAGIQNCESFTTEITAMEARIMTAIRDQAKRETATTQPANLIPDDGAGAGSEAA